MAISLTKRELEVLALIAKELTTNDISIQLKISASTVESHRRNLLRKAGAKNAVGLITESFRRGWL
jgi:DNA-binding CsgD family transcriptional regulator